MPAFAPTASAENLAPARSANRSAIPLLSTWIGSWQFAINREPLAGEQVKGAYDARAKGWAKRLSRLSVMPSYEEILAHILNDAPQSQNAQPLQVLDAGIGAGDLSLAFAKTYDEAFKLNAFDISPRMLDEAKQRLGSEGVSANLHLADATRLPFEDNQFDIAMTAHMLEHLANPSLALAELRRVLKPGGRLITFITRRSMFGFGVQLKWRVHAVTPATALTWLAASGLEDVYCVEREGKTLLDKLSVVTVGRKPCVPYLEDAGQ